MKCIFSLALYCAFAAAQTAPVKHLYVEPFPAKRGAEELRRNLISQIRKLSSIALVSTPAAADATLSGDGEVWIRGYQSLNPRSGRSPSNGTPIYSGFLSVELKDAQGGTIWSDLLTPSLASADIAANLSKGIAKHLAAALEHPTALNSTAGSAQPVTSLKAAGATFPSPIYEKWFANYRRQNPNVGISYDAIGSEEGVRRLLAGGVDFGASDSPQVLPELAPGEERKFLLFPSVVGAVVPILNLPGFTGDITFTPQALAAIYLGKIEKWNDPILKEANPGVNLPNLNITVVHRADGSGTTYTWTDYLSKTSPDWKTQVGSALAPKWPVGRAALGNDGVAKTVKELGGAIGYVEFIYALQNHLSFGKVRNRSGQSVAAGLESVLAAADAGVLDEDFKGSIVDAPGAGAYPIASFTWFVVPLHVADDAKRAAIAGFLKWMLGPGQRQAAALGYLALPAQIVSRETAAIVRIH
jgi:phosphate ABC transporter phosphate-binding protein